MAPLPVQPPRPDSHFEANRNAPWKPGQSGNPAGRPKGSRHKLATRFFDDLYANWEEQGDACIKRAMFENPAAVLQVVAKLMPQKLEITTPTEGMSDEQFERMLELAERMSQLHHAQATDSLLGKASSVTIEGAAVVKGEGAGSPQGRGSCGGVIDVIPLTPAQAASPPEPLADEPIVRSNRTSERSMGNPTDPLQPQRITCLPPDEGEEDVDPLSLFA